MSLSFAAKALIADKKGIRMFFLRSNLRDNKICSWPRDSSRHSGTWIPASVARFKATASQPMAFISSSCRGNFAMASWPSLSLTEALGLAPPKEDPGPNNNAKSSSVSDSLSTRFAAVSNWLTEIKGGMW